MTLTRYSRNTTVGLAIDGKEQQMVHWIFFGLLVLAGTLKLLAERNKRRWYDLSTASFFVTLAAMVVGIVWGALALYGAQCDRIATQTGSETEFFAVGGCFVTLDDGRSVPIGEDSIGLFLNEVSK